MKKFSFRVYTRYGRVNVVRNPYTSVDTYEERTLSIEIYENKSKDQVWVGWATGRSSGPVKVETLTNTIHRILLEFPPNPAAPNQ